MPPPPHIDRTAFLANLRQSRLLTDEQWEEVVPRLPESRRGRVLAAAAAGQAGRAPHHPHHLGMVHRDIKPANLLVQRHGREAGSPGLLKVSDFGLAGLTEPADKGARSRRPDTLFTRHNTVMG